MRSALLLGALLPFTLASPIVVKRDANAIVASVNDIISHISQLNNTLNGFSKGSLTGIFTVLEIQQQTEDLGDSISAATDTANASESLDSDGSNQVATAVLDLEPRIFSLLDNIQAHKPAFDSVILGVGSVSPQVEQDLEDQKTLSQQLGDAITAKLASPYSDFAPLITGQISDAFDKAIATFATPGGLFSVGPFPSFDDFKAALGQ